MRKAMAAAAVGMFISLGAASVCAETDNKIREMANETYLETDNKVRERSAADITADFFTSIIDYFDAEAS